MLAATLLALVALMTVGTSPVRAGTCDNWIGGTGNDWSTAGNWDGGVPSSTTDACISGSGPVAIIGESAQARSLTLSGAELDITGTSSAPATLTLGADSTIASSGSVVLSSNCTGVCAGHRASALTMSSGTLTNSGTIEPEVGSDGGVNARVLNGDVTNTSTGTINVVGPMEYGAGEAGTLDNLGVIQIANQQSLTVPFGSSNTVTNDAGGLVTNGGTSGVLTVDAGNTFNQGGGTTTPLTVDPADPAVIVDGSNLGATLKYTGTGASTIQVQNSVALNGSLANGQNLVVQGVNSGGCFQSLVTSASGFTNAGTITLTGPCDSGAKTTSGTLTNTGTIVAKAQSTASRELKGSLTNSGTLNINAPTAFDGSGATLTQTAGTTTISPNQFLDLTGSDGTFELKGGLLQSPGSNSSHQGGITGSLNNSGGNIAAGSTTTPGDMTVTGHYTQSSGGTLTAVLAGTQVGTTYSQLGVTGGSTLGGTLDIVTHSGFSPQPGNLFTVLGGSSDSGKFGKLIGEFPATVPIGYKPLYDATDMTLQASRTARLTVNETGSGTVTSSPTGINCPSACTALFFKPQAVMLTEHPASGHKFKGWSGACTGKTTTCKVKMTKTQTVMATFS